MQQYLPSEVSNAQTDEKPSQIILDAPPANSSDQALFPTKVYTS
jgi:hypothetical protein